MNSMATNHIGTIRSIGVPLTSGALLCPCMSPTQQNDCWQRRICKSAEGTYVGPPLKMAIQH